MKFQEVLEVLRKERLYAKFYKCKFWLLNVQFLGHLISLNDILVDPGKIEVVIKWVVPNTPIEIQIFFWLVSYSRRYIQDYSKIAVLSTCLTKKIVTFYMGLE